MDPKTRMQELKERFDIKDKYMLQAIYAFSTYLDKVLPENPDGIVDINWEELENN